MSFPKTTKAVFRFDELWPKDDPIFAPRQCAQIAVVVHAALLELADELGIGIEDLTTEIIVTALRGEHIE